MDYLSDKIWPKFCGSCLKQAKLGCTHGTIVNIYIVYEFGASSPFTNDPTLKNPLFGAIKLIENVDIDKHWYSGCGIRFDRKGSFSFPGGRYGHGLINFEVDMSSSVHVDNKKKDILILRKDPK